MYDDETLQEAFARGQTGLGGTLDSLAGSQLVNVQMPDASDARDWMVTLAAMRFGTRGTHAIVAGVPVDAQVLTDVGLGAPLGGLTRPPEVGLYSIRGYYVQVEWGTGNVRERAYVSYPFGGATFYLRGAALRIQLPGSTGQNATQAGENLPYVGAFVAPVRGGGQATRHPPVLFTETVVVANAGGTALLWVPPRARGYRLYTTDDIDATGANPAPVVEQVTWSALAGAPQVGSLDSKNAELYAGGSNALSISGGNAAQRATRWSEYATLHPVTVGLRFTNPSALDIPVGVEWILDLG